MTNAVRLGIVVACCVVGIAALAEPLGSPGFQPSGEQPIGWRGDGTGRFPAAQAPTSWERKATADGYAMKGIAWATPLPNGGVGSPIIVGDKIFLTSEVYDLMALEKGTGKVLWIRSNPEFEGLSEEERAGNPAYAEKLTPLLAELAKANVEAVAALNARLATAGTSAAPRQPEAAIKRKRDLEKQIQGAQVAIDKKKFAHDWRQEVFGFSGPTPTSDGKHVYVFFTTGVVACYDLEGNRKWINRGGTDMSEHGNFASPLLCGDRLAVWANEMRGYEAQTGKLAWSNPAKCFNTYGSMFKVKSGEDWVAGFQWGYFTRVRDGKAIWDSGAFGDAVPTPIVEGNMIFARVGYPRFNEKKKGMKAFKVPEGIEIKKMAAAYEFKEEWGEDELTVDKKKNPFDREFVASPLFVEGLIYQVTQGGGFLVNDAATGELVYRKVLPLAPRTQYWNWAGCSASPTLAGKLIYLMDNQGKTIIIKPGRSYEEVGQNVLVELRDGKEQAQFLSSPFFEGGRMYYRTPGFLYCIGQ